MKIQESIVVEGRHDEAKLKGILDAHIIVTQGTHLSLETLAYIVDMHQDHGVIIFTDPDTPGKLIRQRILERIPEAKQAFLAQKDAREKRKVGIEHASPEHILAALENLYTFKEQDSMIQMKHLIELGLSGQADSASRRNKLCHQHHLQEGNAKLFLQQVNAKGLDLKDLRG